MTVIGRVQNGAIVLDAPLALPEGTTVEVEVKPFGADTSPPAEKLPRSLLERLGPLVGSVSGLPADASQNVDHYLTESP